MSFIEINIVGENWRQREAAIMAFSSILCGPSEDNINALCSRAFPVVMSCLDDPNALVRSSKF